MAFRIRSRCQISDLSGSSAGKREWNDSAQYSLGICDYRYWLQPLLTSCLPYATDMKTSRIIRETAKITKPISHADFVPHRQTRSFAASLQSFTYNGNVTVQKVEKGEPLSDDDSSLSSLGSGSPFDIEDAPFEESSARKRKRGFDSPLTAVTSISTVTSTRTSPRKASAQEEHGTVSKAGKARKAKRQPAKRIVSEAGEEEVEPPANWEEIYDAVREMRKGKLAPVDTMGCETLADERVTPRVSRAQLLHSYPR